MKSAIAKKEPEKGRRLAPEPNRVPRWVLPSVKAGIILTDAMLAFLCFALAFYIREGAPVFAEGTWGWSSQFLPYAAVAAFVVPIRVSMMLYQSAYKMRGAFSYIPEFIRVFKAVLAGSLFIIAATFLFRGGFAFRDFSYSRGVFVLDFLLALTAFSIFHFVIRYLQSAIRRRDVNLIPTLIVGTNRKAEQTYAELQEQPDLGYRVVGVIETGNPNQSSETSSKSSSIWDRGNGVGIVGALSELPEIIKRLEIQEVIITDSELPKELLFETMMQCSRRRKVEFRLAPTHFDYMPQKTSAEQIGILPVVSLFREPLSEAERFLKRVSDILISAFSIVILSPAWILFAALIKVDSKGGILFSQERVGMDGRKFLCYKFRTMRVDADDQIHREAYLKNIEGNLEANAGDEESPVFGKVKDDPRVTRVGRLLRRSSLDELPQLLNVLRGDMSIVGPRPPIPYEVEQYEIWHRKRLDMKPGMTGLWQVSGRNRLPFGEMVRIDLYYIENWSLWLDLRIILQTLPAIVRGDGAK